MISIRSLALLAAILAFAAPARAQTPDAPPIAASDTLREIRLTDGSVLYGRIESVDGERVVIVTTAGARVEVERARIRSVGARPVVVRRGEVWRRDPNATRLFFAPTGTAMRAGEGYFGVYELFFPFISFGITDRVTVAGGTPILPFSVGDLAYFAPKVQVVDAKRLDVSVGGFGFVGTNGNDWAGIGFAVGTYGSPENSVTAGVGIPFTSRDDNDYSEDFTDGPLLMLGGETQIGRNSKLLTENYLVRGEDAVVISGGARFFGENLSADFGVAAFVGSRGTDCCLPLVNFVYKWGKK